MSESKTEVVGASCCGGPAPQKADACCVQDANAKASGETGCGCQCGCVSVTVAPAAPACCG